MVSRKFWSSENFGPGPIFSLKILVPRTSFFEKSGPDMKILVRPWNILSQRSRGPSRAESNFLWDSISLNLGKSLNLGWISANLWILVESLKSLNLLGESLNLLLIFQTFIKSFQILILTLQILVNSWIFMMFDSRFVLESDQEPPEKVQEPSAEAKSI